jgi:Tol biopolymer transport system component
MSVSFFRASAMRLLACLVACLSFPALAAASDSVVPAYCAACRIVFRHPKFDATGTLTSSTLSVATLGGTTIDAPTPATGSVIDNGPSWAPDGYRFAFVHGASLSGVPRRFDILSYDTRTRRVRRMTSGPGNFSAVTWGPRNRIAFLTRYRYGNCLSVIEADGRQHDLFCPPRPAELKRPMWSADGTHLYVQAGYDAGEIEPFWRSLAYRIDAVTGAATVLDDRELPEPMPLEFSPDGRRGIFSNLYPYTAEMTLVNFATGATRTLPSGYAPRWSKNGRRIAFTREVYEINPPSVRYYEALFVMRADGSNVCRVTKSRVDNHADTAVDWSRDGVHLLMNRRVYLDPSLTIPRYSMRMVNVDTGALNVLPNGFAEPGALFEQR